MKYLTFVDNGKGYELECVETEIAYLAGTMLEDRIVMFSISEHYWDTFFGSLGGDARKAYQTMKHGVHGLGKLQGVD